MRLSTLVIGTLIAGVLSPPVAGQPEVDAPAETDSVATFEQVWQTIADKFYDPTLNGVDWAGLKQEFEPRAARAASPDELASIINAMLAHLGTSHTRFYTDLEPAYYQLLAIFRSGRLGEAIDQAHPGNPELRYPGIGIMTWDREGETFVKAVLDGWPAHEAGLRVGDRIIAVDGQPFHPILSFRGKVGARAEIEIQRTRDEEDRRPITVAPVMIDPEDLFHKAMVFSVRVVERSGARVGYAHMWSYAGEIHQEQLQREVAFGRLKEADALVLDLRDGWGGADPRYLNLFNPNVPRLARTTRLGERTEIDFQWRKPVVLLVNGGTRSGKELIAYGFRKFGLGPVVGERTAGAVVAGQPFLIGPGRLLYVAVADVQVEGERLEGRGVEPDIRVPFSLPYADGADPQLEVAIDTAARHAGSPGPR